MHPRAADPNDQHGRLGPAWGRFLVQDFLDHVVEACEFIQPFLAPTQPGCGSVVQPKHDSHQDLERSLFHGVHVGGFSPFQTAIA